MYGANHPSAEIFQSLWLLSFDKAIVRLKCCTTPGTQPSAVAIKAFSSNQKIPESHWKLPSDWNESYSLKTGLYEHGKAKSYFSMLQKCLAQPKPNDVDKRNLTLCLSEQEECKPAKYLLISKIAALGVLEVLDGLSKILYHRLKCCLIIFVNVNILLEWKALG